MKREGQSSIEFMIIVAAVLFFFSSFVFFLQVNISDEVMQERQQVMMNIARAVQEEILLALSASDGYERTFFLPERAINLEYNISFVANSVYLQTLDGKHALALPVANITGDINVGSNTIRKVNGSVYLNT